MEEIKKGDVVQLKSGGPKMTVSDLGDYSGGFGPQDGVAVEWFAGTKRESAVFDRAVLEKVS